jgi:hypothetical protein
MTNNDNRSDTSPLNYGVLVLRRGRCGTTIIGGIGSPQVIVAAIPAIKVWGVLLTERRGE